MELCPPLHLGVVAIEKGAFRLPSSKVANFTYLLVIFNPSGILCCFHEKKFFSYKNSYCDKLFNIWCLWGIGHYGNAKEFMYFKQEGVISILSGDDFEISCSYTLVVRSHLLKVISTYA